MLFRYLIKVTITPNGAWGGEGSLGCGIGYGYLHRIPVDGKPLEQLPASPVRAFKPLISKEDFDRTNTTLQEPQLATPVGSGVTAPALSGTMHSAYQTQVFVT